MAVSSNSRSHVNAATWGDPSRRGVLGRVRGQNTHLALCDQNRGDGGYGICYGLGLQAALRRVGKGFVVEVFSAKCPKKKQVVVACGVCNVADKAALHILLRLKARIGNGFQLFVTL